MKDADILKRLRGIRSFRQERAETELGRQRRLTRQAEATVDDAADRLVSHIHASEGAERRRLQSMTGTIVEASSLNELESQRSTGARKAARLAEQEANARAGLKSSLERLGEAQDGYRKQRASALKLEELIKHGERRSRTDDNDEWPS